MSPARPGSVEAEIGQRMRLVRSHLRVSQEVFAELIGVKRGHLSHIEMQRVAPSMRAIIGVLTLDVRHPDRAERFVDPTWLLLGPMFEKDMWGKTRHASAAQIAAANLALDYTSPPDDGAGNGAD